MSATPATPGVVVSRPRRLTRVCRVVAVMIVAVFAAVGTALRGGPEGAAQFQLADQIAMTVLGLLVAVGVLLLTRARVVADAHGVRVRNVVGDRFFPWQVVTAVRMDDGTWARLELQDDETVGLIAVQAADGDQAVQTVLDLRALLRASRQGPQPAGGPADAGRT